jgi:hypothetical protein
MEGSIPKLKEIDSKHMLSEDTNLISRVDVNSLSQKLSHSPDITTDTALEKLCLLRTHRLTRAKFVPNLY